MKNTFPGYCKKTEIEIKDIWENGLICFDANVLLNLYRYSNETREALLKLISDFSTKIYLPHQAALEYNRNRYEVIAEQEKTYKAFIDKISQIQKDLQSTSKPPFLSSKVHNSINNVFKNVNEEVNDSIEKYSTYLVEDPIYNRIVDIFSSRITEPFEEKKLNEIIKEGEERFKNKIPPGFEDEKNKSGIRKYGDLILWKQILQLAKEKKTPIIFITDERKIDWWWKIKDGRNMGPRQELVEEIYNEANVDFHMYSSERFLSYGQELNKEKVNEKALREIQEMKRAEIEEIENIRRFKVAKKNTFEKEVRLKEELHHIELKIKDINKHLHSQRGQLDRLYNDSDGSPDMLDYLHNHSRHLAEFDEEKEYLHQKREKLLKEREILRMMRYSKKDYISDDEDNN
jgi:predicted nucleic acid-binding protein